MKQKMALGLLPQEACGRLDASGLTRVEPMLAIAEPEDRSACWQSIKHVMAEMDQAGLPQPLLPLQIARIQEANGEVMVDCLPALRGEGVVRVCVSE
ncbi:MAG: hypothetical protein WCI17_02115 [bacterium]